MLLPIAWPASKFRLPLGSSISHFRFLSNQPHIDPRASLQATPQSARYIYVNSVKHIIVSLQLLPCFIALFAPITVSSKPPQNQPNIILILADDQRWDSVGFMGQKNGQTPHLDQLAKEGFVFENAFVTSAICTPSRVSYFLGQYERKHGVNFNSGTAISQNAWKAAYPNLLKNSRVYHRLYREKSCPHRGRWLP